MRRVDTLSAFSNLYMFQLTFFDLHELDRAVAWSKQRPNLIGVKVFRLRKLMTGENFLGR